MARGFVCSRHNIFVMSFRKTTNASKNVVYTDDVLKDREQSLLHMRHRIFTENEFDSAVFIGGMGGIVEEY
ncbi:hypothetical protein J2793_005149 [Paraburkholderia caledonica]|uniref:Purine-nucleoside phosphorylase n=1 Tax=Paraburkholderia caledonica TaxID=134536 RepID=A0AB73INN4_9BURK|nr:hypothetical protein [Paraburkholderia caledonica]